MKIVFFSLFAIALSSAAYAQAVPGAIEPGRTEGRFETQDAARSQYRELRGLESTIPPSQAAQIPLRINSIVLDGNSVLSQSEISGVLVFCT